MNKIRISKDGWTEDVLHSKTRTMTPSDKFASTAYVRRATKNTLDVTTLGLRPLQAHYAFNPEKEDA